MHQYANFHAQFRQLAHYCDTFTFAHVHYCDTKRAVSSAEPAHMCLLHSYVTKDSQSVTAASDNTRQSTNTWINMNFIVWCVPPCLWFALRSMARYKLWFVFVFVKTEAPLSNYTRVAAASLSPPPLPPPPSSSSSASITLCFCSQHVSVQRQTHWRLSLLLSDNLNVLTHTLITSFHAKPVSQCM